MGIYQCRIISNKIGILDCIDLRLCFANQWTGFYMIETFVMKNLEKVRGCSHPILRVSNFQEITYLLCC